MTATGKFALGGGMLLLLGLSAYIDFTVGFWGDQEWELLVARMWLGGKRLYIDHVPVTGPLLFYLYSVPVLLSQHLPAMQDFQALVLLSLCAIGVVIALCLNLIARHPGFGGASLRMQFAALLGFLLIVRIEPPFFGDREHILVCLSLPYLLRWMPGLSDAPLSLRLRLLIGTLAAVGFCNKPQYLLVFASIQLVTILNVRNLRILASPENLAIYFVGALYGLIIWVWTPEYLSLVLPMAYFTYSAIRGNPAGMYALALSVALTFALWRPGDRSPYRKDIGYFAALLPLLYLYAQANNGWTYSYMPLMTALMLANGFMLWEFLYLKHQVKSFAWRRWLGIALCGLNFALQIKHALHYDYEVLIHPCRGNSACPGAYFQPLVDELKGPPQARSFGAIGMDFIVWARVAKLSGAQWDTRFPQLWMIPRLYVADDAFYTAHQGIFYYAANALAEDLDRNKPDVVFVEVSSTIYGWRLQRLLDWVGDFSAVPAFKAAWTHYGFVHRIDNCSVLPPDEDALTIRPPGVKVKERNCRYDVYRRLQK